MSRSLSRPSWSSSASSSRWTRENNMLNELSAHGTPGRVPFLGLMIEAVWRCAVHRSRWASAISSARCDSPRTKSRSAGCCMVVTDGLYPNVCSNGSGNSKAVSSDARLASPDDLVRNGSITCAGPRDRRDSCTDRTATRAWWSSYLPVFIVSPRTSMSSHVQQPRIATLSEPNPSSHVQYKPDG